MRTHAQHLGHCDDCAKRTYLSKALAKEAARKLDRTMRAYQCPSSHLWHVGHLPAVVLRGALTRGEIYPRGAA